MGAALPTRIESELWNTSPQDKNFRNIFLFLFAFTLAFGILIYQYQVPPQPLEEKIEKKPVITKIQLEKKPVVKPEPVVEPEPAPIEEPKPEPEPEPAPPEPKPEPAPPAPKPEPAPPAPKPEPAPPAPQPTPAQQREAARQNAQNAGLAALTQNLSGLTARADAAPQASASEVIAAKRDSGQAAERLYASSATQARANLSGQATSGNLDARIEGATTGGATSSAGGGDAVIGSGGSPSGNGTGTSAGQRDEASVRRVFEQSKASASALYNRALRQNPTMSGRVTFEVVIAPNGSVTSAKIVESQLNDADLERKLLLKVKSLQFGAKPVGVLQLRYSYDFLPS